MPDNTEQPVFQVKRGQSANQLKWCVFDIDERMVNTLSQKLNIDSIVSQILLNRGLKSVESTEKFLNSKLRDILPDPFGMQDMEKAANRIVSAIEAQEKITIFADYDVDGATSSALLYRFFKMVGITTEIYVPSRLLEGYGPNAQAMRTIKESGTSLVITVDCGSTSYDPLQVAYDLGLDVIVVDHHIAPADLPKAYAIVNPNRIDDDFEFKAIAAVAVAFFCVIAIRKQLRDKNWFALHNMAEPDLMTLLDLVALGTVCDVMPLIDINRVFVKHGLSIIHQRNNLGIATLFDIAKVKSAPQAYHLGYVIGPRINAGGRVDESKLGAYLLISDNKAEAYGIAAKLEELNEERKAIESKILAEAFETIEKNNSHIHPIIFTYGNDWHIGILGILASRIKERYNKPVAVISINNRIGKGSARSVSGINLGALISDAKLEGLLLEGGGHAMAGGFTVQEDKMVSFIEYAINRLNKQDNTQELINQAAEIYVDAAISARAATRALVQSLEKIGPFGNGNPAPRLAIYEAKILRLMPFGQNHISIIIADSIQGGLNNSHTLKCVIFKILDKPLGQQLLHSKGKAMDLIGSLQLSNFDASGVQFIVEDFVLYE